LRKQANALIEHLQKTDLEESVMFIFFSIARDFEINYPEFLHGPNSSLSSIDLLSSGGYKWLTN
jgi:hypothetical protein